MIAKKLLLIILIGFLIPKVLACDCSLKWIKENSDSALFEINYAEADLIFIGTLDSTHPNGKSYSFKILETLKGNQLPQIVEGRWFSSCSVIPIDTLSIWLVYANTIGNFIDISSCGPTRNFDKPFWLGNVPPPPARNTSDLEWGLEYYKAKRDAIDELFIDIDKLREKKKTPSANRRL